MSEARSPDVGSLTVFSDPASPFCTWCGWLRAQPLLVPLRFLPVGKPAPPRPRSPEALTISMIASGPAFIRSAVLSQSPRACAAFKSGGW